MRSIFEASTQVSTPLSGFLNFYAGVGEWFKPINRMSYREMEDVPMGFEPQLLSAALGSNPSLALFRRPVRHTVRTLREFSFSLSKG